jgi:hypothetical protein
MSRRLWSLNRLGYEMFTQRTIYLPPTFAWKIEGNCKSEATLFIAVPEIRALQDY